jgi:hypothetical protein
MAKDVSVSELCDTIIDVIAEKEEIAKLKGEPFSGIHKIEFIKKFAEKLEDDIYIQRDPTVQFTDNDVNAAASARFFKGTGMNLVLGWLFLVTLTVIAPIYIPVPQFLLWVLNGIYAVVFMWIYTRELRKLRKKIWAGLGRPNER